MSQLNVSVLAYGRDSYLRQLKLHLTPLIYDGLVSLYEDAQKIEQETNEFENNYLKQFQKLLTLIPTWNQSILEEETRRILTEVDFLMEMVAAVFVAQVQILASVKLGGNNSKIRVKIPTSDIFIHAVYRKAAETFYYNPYKFQTYHVRESKEYIRDMINKNIDEVIDDMIPIESIIKEYISNVFTAHTKENPKTVETIEEEPPGRILNHNDLGLGDMGDMSGDMGGGGDFGHNSGKKMSFDETPLNDDFGAGKGDHFGKTLGAGEGGDDFMEELDVGKDPELSEKTNNFSFRDDETDIFSSSKPASKDDDVSPFKEAVEDVVAKEEPVFKAMVGSNEKDPFKSNGNEDPFKSSGGEDPFKNSGGTDEDPFKNDSGIGNLDDIPNPPELEKDGIFSQKPDEINFFDDIP